MPDFANHDTLVEVPQISSLSTILTFESDCKLHNAHLMSYHVSSCLLTHLAIFPYQPSASVWALDCNIVSLHHTWGLSRFMACERDGVGQAVHSFRLESVAVDR